MKIKSKWLRDLSSMIFTVYYLFHAEQADEKVRKVRGMLTVDHLRVAWNKPTTPYLSFITNLMRPRFMRYKPRAIRIPRPRESAYKEPVEAWLYFDGPISALTKHNKIVLDVPGGGFVAMDPRAYDDKLLAWAGKTGLPVLSLDYKKAPEHPYPYALNECYDVYHTLVASRGRCIGLSGETAPNIVVAGDSAGGNLAVGTVLMILQSASSETRRWQGEIALPPPVGLVLIYPALDMNIGSWMTDEQMALIRDRRTRKTNEGVLRQKSEDYKKLTPTTPHHSDEELDEDEGNSSPPKRPTPGDSAVTVILAKPRKSSIAPEMAHTTPTSQAAAVTASTKPQRTLKTRLAMSSMISYFNDRILTPEMMRAMVILYVGPHNRPDFATDFLLCPLLAPEPLLAKFPKTYFLTGERDPLVDDTVIFAGRLRQAHSTSLLERKELGLEKDNREFHEEDHVEVVLVPGISHGFFNFVGVFPEGWKYIFKCSTWISEIFERVDLEEDRAARSYNFNSRRSRAGTTPMGKREGQRHHRRKFTESSGDEDRPLEMSMIRVKDKGKGVENGRVEKKEEGKGRRRPSLRERRRKSLVSLASEDDLLGRRMMGFTSGLLSMEDEGLPPTP
jgi:acetyl esterase/lipase